MSTVNAKGLTNGAMMAGLTAVLMFVGTFIPMFGMIILMVVGVPITMVFLKHNTTVGIVSSVVATVLVAILMGPIYAVGFFIQFMLMAIAYGIMLAKGSNSGKTLIVGTLTAVLATILIMVISVGILGFDVEAQKENYNNIIDTTIEIYEQTGMLDQLSAQGYTTEDLRQMIGTMTSMMISIIPGVLILSSAISAIVHYLVVSKVASRAGIKVNKLPPFIHWHLPWQTVWGLIVVWILWLIGDRYQMDMLVLISKNILMVYGIILLVLGAAVLKYFLNRYKLSGFGWALVILFIFMFFGGVIVMSALVGMFDLVFDFRKLKSGAVSAEKDAK